MQEIEVVYSGEVCRLDVLTSQLADITRSYAAKIIDDGYVGINGNIVSKNTKVKNNDTVRIVIPDPVSDEALPENIPLDIVYEDNDLLVVNKPKGMVVHPAAGQHNGTLVNALLYHCKGSLSGIGGVSRPGIVHRIDKDTSGLLIVAKNDNSHNFLAQQIKEHSFTREYEAIVYGNVKNNKGTINAPIGRHPVKRKQMAVTPVNSRDATTHYEVIGRYNGFTHLKLRLETGRTHQIRVHMSYIGYALAGDELYGPKKVIKELNGQCLHARKIGFIHPTTKEYMEFSSQLPLYFINFLEKLGNEI
ncbi:MAG: RluA family pseudouridine synthase [Acutalibacteraceae bacterium]|nr:RluA family pseudouridine synthase [Acutalibacteraceae bacterium]